MLFRVASLVGAAWKQGSGQVHLPQIEPKVNNEDITVLKLEMANVISSYYM